MLLFPKDFSKPRNCLGPLPQLGGMFALFIKGFNIISIKFSKIIMPLYISLLQKQIQNKFLNFSGSTRKKKKQEFPIVGSSHLTLLSDHKIVY